MNRRALLGSIGGTGVFAAAGCVGVGGTERLADPRETRESTGWRTLVFTADGEEVAKFGANGSGVSDRVELSTQIWHQDGTNIERISLTTWMPGPEQGSPGEVAVVAPVEGDSSPPPELTLYTPDQNPGTTIEISDLDDLADETISTIELVVRPRSETATKLAIDTRIELSDGGFLGTDYTLTGELELKFPALGR